MRTPLIAGNWKMYKSADEAVNLVQTIKAGVYKISGCDIVICPPFIALSAVSKILGDGNIDLGAQNMHPETEGAFTGEISPLMLKDVGCRYVIAGHSERRQLFHESDAFINQKVKTALKYSLIPIFCLGETLQEREGNRQFEIVKHQLEHGLKDLPKEDIARTVIAYEPVWAIGTGKTASPEQAEQMQSYIRRLLKEKYSEENASRIRILYGGSVRPDNIEALMGKPNVDGALVGGASLKGESFIQIVVGAVQTQETGAKAES